MLVGLATLFKEWILVVRNEWQQSSSESKVVSDEEDEMRMSKRIMEEEPEVYGLYLSRLDAPSG